VLLKPVMPSIRDVKLNHNFGFETHLVCMSAAKQFEKARSGSRVKHMINQPELGEKND